MSLSDLEHHVFAYYAAGQASELSIAPRWYPHGELILIIEDKMTVAVRKFGRKVRAATKAAATHFLDSLIEQGVWETKQNEFGGQMHQFNGEAYKKALADLRASDPVIAKADTPEYWEKAFAELTGQAAA